MNLGELIVWHWRPAGSPLEYIYSKVGEMIGCGKRPGHGRLAAPCVTNDCYFDHGCTFAFTFDNGRMNERLPVFPRWAVSLFYPVDLAFYPTVEARGLGHHFSGTERLLLGLIHENEDVTASVLERLSITLPETRKEAARGSTARGVGPVPRRGTVGPPHHQTREAHGDRQAAQGGARAATATLR